jgi:hypothetical protein
MCGIILRRRPSDVVVHSDAAATTFSLLTREVTRLLISPLVSDFLPIIGFFVDLKAKASMARWRSSFTALVDRLVAERRHRKKEDVEVEMNCKKLEEEDARVSTDDDDILDVLLKPENDMSHDMIAIHFAVSPLFFFAFTKHMVGAAFWGLGFRV